MQRERERERERGGERERERERENSGSSDGNIHLRCLVSETGASSTRQGGERGGVSHI
jgi:hypothetical protein